MDTYPLDPENLGQFMPIDLSKASETLHFSIQNPILSFFSDVLSIMTFIILLLFVYAVARCLIIFLEGLHQWGTEQKWPCNFLVYPARKALVSWGQSKNCYAISWSVPQGLSKSQTSQRHPCLRQCTS